eukprot:scaffold58022_cov75-Phaeocystis_antarctica.AAC.3
MLDYYLLDHTTPARQPASVHFGLDSQQLLSRAAATAVVAKAAEALDERGSPAQSIEFVECTVSLSLAPQDAADGDTRRPGFAQGFTERGVQPLPVQFAVRGPSQQANQAS